MHRPLVDNSLEHSNMEINYVLEDNYHMNYAIHKLLAKPLRLYRVYQRVL